MNSHGSIPIVQGTAVPDDPYNKNSYNPAPTNGGNYGQLNNDYNQNNQDNTIHFANNDQQQQQQQSQQPKQFKDVIWAVAFVVHLGAMFVLITMNIASGNGGGGDGDGDGGSYGGLLFLVGVTALTSVALSSLTISLMMKYPIAMIKTALIFSTILLLVMAIAGFMSGSVFAGAIGLFFFAVTCCYAKSVWHRIPFAACKFFSFFQQQKQQIVLLLVFVSIYRFFPLLPLIISITIHLYLFSTFYFPSKSKYGINCC